MDKFLNVDVLVVGSGLAGLSTAYFVSRSSRYSIAVSSKSAPGYGSSTYYSQAAFRCPTGRYTKDDYVRDVLEGGRYINRRWLIDILASNCREDISELCECGLVLKETPIGYRVVSSDPIFPGREIVSRLVDHLRSKDVFFLDRARVVDISRLGDGSYSSLHERGGELIAVRSKVVVLATGGAANAYSRSDNPVQLTCDGHGIALKLGLPLVDMEFVQFFPLGLAEEGRPAVIIPFTKGRILNSLGEDIVQKYGLGDLEKAITVYRDATSRYMVMENREGRGIGGALLAYPEESADELSRAGFELVRRLGLRLPVKVLPTAHYTMGGVEVDRNLRTELPGLYVVGELVGGVHGANRLGGNALTACVTLSRRVAADVVRYLEKEFGPARGTTPRFEPASGPLEVPRLGGRTYDIGMLRKLRDEIRETMWKYVGVVRDGDELGEAVNYLQQVLDEVRELRIGNVSGVAELVELENTVMASTAITLSALARKESRGAHYRLDYPEERSEWIKSIKIRLVGGKFIVSEEEVT